MRIHFEHCRVFHPAVTLVMAVFAGVLLAGGGWAGAVFLAPLVVAGAIDMVKNGMSFGRNERLWQAGSADHAVPCQRH